MVNSGQLKATYEQEDETISFYVNNISIGKRPLLKLRVSDHRPIYQKYIRPDLIPPSSGMGVNISIEFYKPKYKENGKKVKDKVNTGVSIKHSESEVIPFVICSYKYKPELLNEADVDDIYKAILAWIYGGCDAMYKDPFENTDKAAIPQARESVLKNNNQENKNINCNRNMNKKLIRLTESDLHRIVKRSVKRMLREGMYYDEFQSVREMLGDEQILDELVQYLSSDELRDFVDHLKRYYDLDY